MNLVSINSKVSHLVPLAPVTNWESLLTDWLKSKPSPNTQNAYRTDLDRFLSEAGLTLGQFLTLTKSEAFSKVSSYRGDMLARSLSPATINRRLSAIKSIVSYAYKSGYCEFNLDKMIDGVKSQSYRDTTGITLDQFKQVLGAVDLSSLKGLRDYAILHLLWSNALRRSEVNGLNRSDFEPQNNRIRIKGKGQIVTQWVTISEGTVKALATYLTARKDDFEPLFIALDKGHFGNRLTTESINKKVVGKYCKLAGITKQMSPHRIRHSAITTALDLTNGDVRSVQKLSRHSSLNTLLIYDDNRVNAQGKMTDLLSSVL